MFKLLLVTDQDEVKDVFLKIHAWEAHGFKTPRIVSSAEEAMASLGSHHADVIAISLSDAEKRKLLSALEEKPDLPIMQASAEMEITVRNLHEAEQVLSRVNRDVSNDRYDRHERMLLARHAYFRRFLSGYDEGEEALRRRLALLRSHMDPDRRCVLMHMYVNEIADYLEVRWHYGVDRLEVAIRNIFGAEKNGLRMLFSMDGGEHAYLIACPMLGSGEISEQMMLDTVREHAEQGISHVEEYIGLSIRPLETVVLPSILSLSRAARQMESHSTLSEEDGKESYPNESDREAM